MRLVGRWTRKLGGAAVVALVVTFAWGTSQAVAAPTIVREVPINTLNNPYTPLQDGSVWMTYATSGAGGTVVHLDGQTGGIIDSFFVAINGYFPKTIGYANNRVYIVSGSQILSFTTNQTGATNPGLVFSDAETGYRLGSNQMFMRLGSDGTATIALGQSNRVAALNFNDLSASHPFYPQAIYGAGVNAGSGTGFEVCNVSAPDSAPPGCGQGGDGGPAAGQFDYPTDAAPDGAGGFFVTEYSDHTVSHVVPTIVGGEGQYVLSKFGSGPGPAAGQLSSPSSIRRIPDTGRLAVLSQGTRRVDEWAPAGAYERSYGFGVLTGADEFETCGVDIGACQAGLPYQTDPRSYFTQLDIVDGRLWIGTPLDGSIQVVDLDGGGGGSKSLDLKASPVKIKKGEKATLTATLENCDGGAETITFQIKNGSTFKDLGSALAPNGACKAAKKTPKIKDTQIFQAVAEDSEGSPIDTSPKVKVKLKE